MKKYVCTSLLALSFLVSMLAAAAPASAKGTNDLRAQVPFDFYVGDARISAGDCRVTSMNSDETGLRIEGNGGRQTALTLSSTKSGGINSKISPRLVFHKYGDQYFLAAVWGGDQDGRVLPKSKRERMLEKEMRVAQQAGAAAMEVVTVEAR
jgi:hypothetical protein